LALRSNYGPILYRFPDIKRQQVACPWNTD